MALVLIVDDDEDNRRLLRARLPLGHEVIEAGDGPSALEAAKARAPDLVLLDVMMPGMSGFEACGKLKDLQRPALVPVLLMTALDDQDSRNRGLEAGADDYLAKPFDKVELELRVKHFLELREKDQLLRKQHAELAKLEAWRQELTELLVHDLRNPLSGVSSAFQLLEHTELPPRDRDLVVLGLDATRRLTDMIEDLLKVQLLEHEHLTLDRESVQVEALLQTAARIAAPLAKEQNVKLEVRAQPQPSVALDQRLMLRALGNLIANALRYTKGEVELSATRDETHVTFSVSDRGPGVPDAVKPHLFVKYGAHARGGHGLGLYLVQRVAVAHGGTASVSDREGGGATFSLKLPLREA